MSPSIVSTAANDIDLLRSAAHNESTTTNEYGIGSTGPISQTDPSKITAEPNKKAKKVRDPDLPKRPASAFFLFQNAVRSSVKSAMPDSAKGLDIQKAISEKWKELSDGARKPYDEQHENEQKAYEKKLATYKKENGIASKTKAVTTSKDPANGSQSKTKSSIGVPNNDDDDAAAASLVRSAETPLASPGVPHSVKKRSRKSETAETTQKTKTPKKAEKQALEKK